MEESILTYMLTVKKILTKDGNIDSPTISDYMVLLEDGPQRFYDNVVKWHNDNDFGVDFTTTSKCIHCNNVITINIPIENFFV